MHRLRHCAQRVHVETRMRSPDFPHAALRHDQASATYPAGHGPHPGVGGAIHAARFAARIDPAEALRYE
jgi:hypothetical protein